MTINIRKNETVLKTGSGAFRRPYVLVHIAAGEVAAGAGTRYQNECYAVLYTIDGNRHGQQYKTLDEAQAHFDRVTTPIPAMMPF